MFVDSRVSVFAPRRSRLLLATSRRRRSRQLLVGRLRRLRAVRIAERVAVAREQEIVQLLLVLAWRQRREPRANTDADVGIVRRRSAKIVSYVLVANNNIAVYLVPDAPKYNSTNTLAKIVHVTFFIFLFCHIPCVKIKILLLLILKITGAHSER